MMKMKQMFVPPNSLLSDAPIKMKQAMKQANPKRQGKQIQACQQSKPLSSMHKTHATTSSFRCDQNCRKTVLSWQRTTPHQMGQSRIEHSERKVAFQPKKLTSQKPRSEHLSSADHGPNERRPTK